jgi:hypothetical protein
MTQHGACRRPRGDDELKTPLPTKVGGANQEASKLFQNAVEHPSPSGQYYKRLGWQEA